MQDIETMLNDTSTPLHLSLLDLERGQCRWPFGDGPITFCGHVVRSKSSYCPHHALMNVGAGTASERAAHRSPQSQDRSIICEAA